MAKPRVFVSSTFYDLRQIRENMEHFIREMGYEPVLNERGSIAYSSEERLEDSCYREVEGCDILISIIGGRYGSTSQNKQYSISQMELRRAVDLGRQVYIFVNKSTITEFDTYLLNKDIPGARYHSVDNNKIFEFIEEIKALPLNNAIKDFETFQDVMLYLREQWAGLFQRLLQNQGRQHDVKLLDALKSTAKMLNELVTFIREEKKSTDQSIQNIILTNHPIFSRLQRVTGTKYRVFFSTIQEMSDWLEVRQFYRTDSDDDGVITYALRTKSKGGASSPNKVMIIPRDTFDSNGNLLPVTPSDLNKEWVVIKELVDDLDDEIPF